MSKKCAVIVIDTGFSLQSISMIKNLMAVYDLRTGSVLVGSPYIDKHIYRRELGRLAGDPLNHGSLVVKQLMARASEQPVILIRAYRDDISLIRTGWSSGFISSDGWTEAYLWAVDLCKRRGMSSVTNCSFGSYNHAMDGSGWESHCIGQVTGKDKPGHVVIAAAGSGTLVPIHASWSVEVGATVDVHASQEDTTTYNFWSRNPDKSIEAPDQLQEDWILEVFLDGELHSRFLAEQVPPNIWNNRRQIVFTVQGKGEVTIRVGRFWKGSDESSKLDGEEVQPLARPILDTAIFDCWIHHQDRAVFKDNIDNDLISEPAVFPQVIAVGLESGNYRPNQENEGEKPDCFLEGTGQISFRLPEVVALVASWLESDPSLDVEAVRNRLGKKLSASFSL